MYIGLSLHVRSIDTKVPIFSGGLLGPYRENFAAVHLIVVSNSESR